MKTIHKKLVCSLLIGLFITAIGVVFATAETEDTTEEINPTMPYESRHGMKGPGLFSYNLTEDQQIEIEELFESLRQQNATREEIREAIQEKLDEYGVLDAQLDYEIEQTQEKLTILNRQKELRDQGYSWDEINTIIQEEFDLENTIDMGFGMTHEPGFGPGPCSRPHDFMPGEEIEQ